MQVLLTGVFFTAETAEDRGEGLDFSHGFTRIAADFKKDIYQMLRGIILFFTAEAAEGRREGLMFSPSKSKRKIDLELPD